MLATLRISLRPRKSWSFQSIRYHELERRLQLASNRCIMPAAPSRRWRRPGALPDARRMQPGAAAAPNASRSFWAAFRLGPSPGSGRLTTPVSASNTFPTRERHHMLSAQPKIKAYRTRPRRRRLQCDHSLVAVTAAPRQRNGRAGMRRDLFRSDRATAATVKTEPAAHDLFHRADARHSSTAERRPGEEHVSPPTQTANFAGWDEEQESRLTRVSRLPAPPWNGASTTCADFVAGAAIADRAACHRGCVGHLRVCAHLVASFARGLRARPACARHIERPRAQPQGTP